MDPMDPQRVTQWIKTVFGILNFVQNIQPPQLRDLLSGVELEKWEKLGDGLDDERGLEMGSIRAEEDFTIIHLLAAMGLQGLFLREEVVQASKADGQETVTRGA
jgi:hypothetical protein